MVEDIYLVVQFAECSILSLSPPYVLPFANELYFASKQTKKKAVTF